MHLNFESLIKSFEGNVGQIYSLLCIVFKGKEFLNQAYNFLRAYTLEHIESN